MSIGIVASLIAFIAYGGLLMLVYQKGLKNDRTHQLFFFYLLDMMLVQAGYAAVASARNAQTALFWYTINISLTSAQVIIYFFFVRNFLHLTRSKTLIRGSIVTWAVVMCLSIIFHEDIFVDVYQDTITGMFLPTIGAIAGILSVPTVFFLFATLAALGKNYRNQSRSQKARIQYLALAILIVWIGMVTNATPSLQPYAIDVIANIVSALLIGYAILRYQLLELNTVLRKGLEAFISIVVFGAGNLIVVFIFTKLLHIDITTNKLLAITLISIISIMILIPLRDRIRQYFGQTLFKTTYDGYQMVQRLSRTATSMLDLYKLSNTLLDDVVNTLQARWGILLLKQKNNSFEAIARKRVKPDLITRLHQNHAVLNWISEKKTNNMVYSFAELPTQITLPVEMSNPELTGSELVPLKTRGELIGILWLGAKFKDRPYSQDDTSNLITIANNIAATINNALLYEELQNELRERKLAEQKVTEANKLLASQLKEIKALQENLRKQVIRDPLTGLFNRRYLYETFDRELARAKRENYPISVIMIDIDHFKEINDTYGHQIGDQALEALGHLLQHSTRQGDIACRYGGDEFIIIMPGIKDKNAQQRAESLRLKIKAISINTGTKTVFITASIGIAYYPKHGNSLDELMKASDDALYEAKHAGRNRTSLSKKKTPESTPKP